MLQLMTDYTELLTTGTVAGTDKFGFTKLTSKLEQQNLAKNAQVFLANNLTQSNLDAITYTYAELVKECHFADAECKESDFVRIMDPTYGACYQFNSKKPVTYRLSRAGIKNGLKMMLTIIQEETDGETDFLATTETSAARVAVTMQDTDVSVDAFGLNAGTGYVNAFAVRFSHMSRLQAPYGTCVNSMSADKYLYSANYSMESCYRSCYQLHIIEYCACGDPRYGLPDGARKCSTVADLECVTALKAEEENVTSAKHLDMLTDCDCNPPCEETTYVTTVSQSRFPADNYAIPSDCALVGNSTAWASEEACITWYRENAMVLQVYFERMNYELYSENVAYDVVAFSWDLGGQIGLWLGFSVITCVEVLGLVILICKFMCARRSTGPIYTPEEDHKKDLNDLGKQLSDSDSDADLSDDNAGKKQKKK
uniref:Uncharacterized protein n=1 Tax=Plectus sambesii TaxID=2011161 RepID=A0A914WQK8_9BILA